MAQSPTHKFGQIIGDILEQVIHPILKTVVDELGLYLDTKCEREARGGKKKVAWVDGKGNTHDLDYVIEAGGSDEMIGTPCAFIEVAWRRYTKHSRNKAQEIQGAILPLAERYGKCHPFLGVVLGGVFTEGSINQLRSHGFAVVYFPYASIVAAFASVNIDATYDEDTLDSVVLAKVKKYERLSATKKSKLAEFLRLQHKNDLEQFTSALRVTLTRTIEFIYVLPLHGVQHTMTEVDQAIAYIESFDESKPHKAFTRYEVGVRYSNGDEVRGQFNEKSAAIEFLRGM